MHQYWVNTNSFHWHFAMPVMLKISVFWNKVPYSLLKVSRCFGGTYHLHFRVEECAKLHVPPKLLNFNGLHDVISQKIALQPPLGEPEILQKPVMLFSYLCYFVISFHYTTPHHTTSRHVTSRHVTYVNRPKYTIFSYFGLLAWLCLLPASCRFFSWFNYWPWWWRRYVLPKLRSTFTGPYSLICQKIDLFIVSVGGRGCSNPPYM
jgi:hypothetical protein